MYLYFSATRPHIVIATPGRLADHLESCKTFSLKKIKYLVLDEADRLLEETGGFSDQLKVIFDNLPSKNKQTLLFSATITESMEQLKNKISMKEQVFKWEQNEKVEDDSKTVENLKQSYVLTPAGARDAYLVMIVKNFVEKQPQGTAKLVL